MNWQRLNELGSDRGAEFYLRCLTYGNTLWQRRLVARAVLCLDRALYAEVSAGDPVLALHPLPYRALAWMLVHVPDAIFIGNPRAHYQHLADRVRGARSEIRSWRAWACWHIVRRVRAEFPSDPKHIVREPSRDEIAGHLARIGLPDERRWWEQACDFNERG